MTASNHNSILHLYKIYKNSYGNSLAIFASLPNPRPEKSDDEVNDTDKNILKSLDRNVITAGNEGVMYVEGGLFALLMPDSPMV